MKKRTNTFAGFSGLRESKQACVAGSFDITFNVSNRSDKSTVTTVYCKTTELAEDVAEIFEALLSTPRISEEDGVHIVKYTDSSGYYTYQVVENFITDLCNDDGR